MSELKTLKDIGSFDRGCSKEYSEDLKSEAVKRWKYFQTLIEIEAKTHIRGEYNTKITSWKARQDELTDFFNLTEENLV